MADPTTPLIKRGGKPITRVYGVVNNPTPKPNVLDPKLPGQGAYDDLVYRPSNNSGLATILSQLGYPAFNPVPDGTDSLHARAIANTGLPMVPRATIDPGVYGVSPRTRDVAPAASDAYPVVTGTDTEGEDANGENAQNPYGIPLPRHIDPRTDYQQLTAQIPVPPNIPNAPQYDPAVQAHTRAGIMKYAQWLPLLSLLGGDTGQGAVGVANAIYGGIEQGTQNAAQSDYAQQFQNWQQQAGTQQQNYENQVRRYEAESRASDRVNDSIDRQNTVIRQTNADADRAYNQAVTNARVAQENKLNRQARADIVKQQIDQKKDADRAKDVRAKVNAAIRLVQSTRGRLSGDAEDAIANFLSDPENKRLVLGTNFLNDYSPFEKAEIARWSLDRKSREKIALDHDSKRLEIAREQIKGANERARLARAEKEIGQVSGDKFALARYRGLQGQMKSEQVAINNLANKVAQKYKEARKVALDPKNQEKAGVMSHYAKGVYDAYVREAQSLEQEIEGHKGAFNTYAGQMDDLLQKRAILGGQYGGATPTYGAGGYGVAPAPVVINLGGAGGQGLPPPAVQQQAPAQEAPFDIFNYPGVGATNPGVANPSTRAVAKPGPAQFVKPTPPPGVDIAGWRKGKR